MWCIAQSVPNDGITWHKDGVSLVNSERVIPNTQELVGMVNATLTIIKLDRSDEGTYTCTVNKTGKLEVSLPRTGYLTVNCKSEVVILFVLFDYGFSSSKKSHFFMKFTSFQNW
jgi:hypothetical protein